MLTHKIEILNKKFNGFLNALKNISKEFKKSNSLEDKFLLLVELSKYEQFLTDSNSSVLPNNWKVLDLFKNQKSNDKIIETTLYYYIQQNTFDIKLFVETIENIIIENSIESMVFFDILFENANIDCNYNQYIKLNNNEKSVLFEKVLNYIRDELVKEEITSISFSENF